MKKIMLAVSLALAMIQPALRSACLRTLLFPPVFGPQALPGRGEDLPDEIIHGRGTLLRPQYTLPTGV